MELSLGSAMACFLAWEGADISYANHKGKSPLDLVPDPAVVQVLKGFAEKHRYGPGRRVLAWSYACVCVCVYWVVVTTTTTTIQYLGCVFVRVSLLKVCVCVCVSLACI